MQLRGGLADVVGIRQREAGDWRLEKVMQCIEHTKGQRSGIDAVARAWRLEGRQRQTIINASYRFDGYSVHP